jgi:hypothetical protein
LRWFGIVLVVLVVAAGAALAAARFHDGPLGMVAGGPLVRGELMTGPEPDWRFVHDVNTVEFQLLSPERSRTTWILEVGGKIYIPCGYMDTTIGRLWKHWPIEAEKDGRAILRVGDKKYERQLVRIQSGELLEPLTKEISRKYKAPATPEAVTSGSLWLFELTHASRPAEHGLLDESAPKWGSRSKLH